MNISMIAALSRNRVIGRDNALPWHLPEDLQHFKRVTMGKPLLMGRKTHESIGRPLPGRSNIILTRQAGLQLPGVQCVNSVEQALALAGDERAEELMVIGGEAIYRKMLPLAQCLHLTEVDVDVEGDAWFPEIPVAEWTEIQREDVLPALDRNFGYSFVTLRRG